MDLRTVGFVLNVRRDLQLSNLPDAICYKILRDSFDDACMQQLRWGVSFDRREV